MLFVLPVNIVITSLGEEGAGRAFVCLFSTCYFCHFSLPLGVGGWLRFVIVALPGLFLLTFFVIIKRIYVFVSEGHMLQWHSCQICYPLEIKLLLLLLFGDKEITHDTNIPDTVLLLSLSSRGTETLLTPRISGFKVSFCPILYSIICTVFVSVCIFFLCSVRFNVLL